MKNEKSLPLHAQDFCEFTEDLIRRLQDYLDSGLFMDDPGIMKGFHAEYVFVFYVPGNDKPILALADMRTLGSTFLEKSA